MISDDVDDDELPFELYVLRRFVNKQDVDVATKTSFVRHENANRFISRGECK